MAESCCGEAMLLSQSGNQVSISSVTTDPTKVLGKRNAAVHAVGLCHETKGEVSGCFLERQWRYFPWLQDAQRNFSQKSCDSGTWSIWQPSRGCGEVTYQVVLWHCPVKMALPAWSRWCLRRSFWEEIISSGWKSQNCKVNRLRIEGGELKACAAPGLIRC